MGNGPTILLTNDDGIESVGFRVLYDALRDVGDVTAVAPIADQSSVGRSISTEVAIHEYDLGYAVEGTPTDCVVAGIGSLVPDVDLVVSGCNEGANLGAYVLGRSGTVSAAVEATFFDVPAIAVSMYIPVAEDVTFRDVDEPAESYAEAARVTEYLAERTLSTDVFETCDYLNVNAPVADRGPAPLRVTEPSTVYDMDATHEDGRITLHDRVWQRMSDGSVPDSPGTDRHAVMDDAVSVSPLSAPHSTSDVDALESLAAEYPAE